VAISQVANLIRATWAWTFVSAGETNEQAEASCYYLASHRPGDDATTQAVLDQLATLMLSKVVANLPTGHWSPSVNLDHARAAWEDTNGHTLLESRIAASGDLAWVGGGSTTSLPWATALCCSLYGYEPGAFDPQGKHKRGRMYLPALGADQLLADGSGKLASDKLNDIMLNWGAVISAPQEALVWADPALTLQLVVNSRSTVQAHAVNWVRMDNKLDTQRRRERQQPFQWFQHAMPIAS